MKGAKCAAGRRLRGKIRCVHGGKCWHHADGKCTFGHKEGERETARQHKYGKVCPRLKKRGACAADETGDCQYLHPPQPKLSSSWRRTVDPRKIGTKPCRFGEDCMLGRHCKFWHPPKEPVERTERQGMGREPQHGQSLTVLEQLLAAERRFHAEREHAVEDQPTPEASVPDGCQFMRGGAVAPSAPATPEMPVGVPVTDEQMQFPPPGVLLAPAAPFAPAVVPVSAAALVSAAPAENEWLDEWLGRIGIRSEATVLELSNIFKEEEIDTPEQFALLFGDWIKKGEPRARTNPVKELQKCISDATGAKLKGGVVGKLLTAMRGDARIQELLREYE